MQKNARSLKNIKKKELIKLFCYGDNDNLY